MSFWEVHAARRRLRAWRLHVRLQRLGDAQDADARLLAACFAWWRAMAAHYRRAAALGPDHWRERACAEAFAAWARRSGGGGGGGSGGGGGGGGQRQSEVAMALQRWMGGDARACLDAWRR